VSEDRPAPPRPQAPVDDWEASVEAAITALQREIERLNHELVKQGGRVNQLMQERSQRRSGARR
jgi:hypothetical protein